MERKEIVEKLVLIIRRAAFRADVVCLSEEDDFKDTLGLDSLDMTAIAMRCEKEFGICFNGEELKIRKVGDLVDFIQGLN
ncbi:MAG: acyl carrier protein [Proteobacteria bacterium]|nr:acyl carrier protein [Pseudomonadota bacterium]